MYLLSGISGAASIVASLFLLFELAGSPLIGGEANSPAFGRVLFFGVVAAASAVISITFHRRANLDPTRRLSPRLIRVEGVSFTFVGGLLLAGGFLWLHFSGGVFGLHFIGFVLGGGLILISLQKLRTRQ